MGNINKQKIFISGIAGFLGSHLADRMLQRGYRVVGCDNLVGGYLDNVPSGVEFYKYDCADRGLMTKIMKDVDVVYHTACLAYEGLSVFSPHIVTRNTYDATASMLSVAIANNVRRFVYCSSMARYGEQETVPFTEDMEPKPQDPYAISKYAAELLIRNLLKIHNMEYVIAVPHNIIGPRQKYDDPYRNVASIMINLMLQGRQPVIYGDGEQKRCFSFVNDVVDPLEKLGFNSNVVGHVINIGPDEEPCTINELAQTIADILNFPLKPIYMNDRPAEVKFATCSADKSRNLIQYSTNTTLNEGLQQMINYIRTRGTKPFQYHLDLEISSDLTPRTWKDRLF
jgi:UDP-glucose 4-epimerase